VDAYDAVVSKLDVREFAPKTVSAKTKLNILEAARMSGTGINKQHWRFILVQDRDNLRKLADDSTSGKWIEHANFAVIILTDPQYGFHLIDAGRAAQNMQIAAWGFGVASGLFTGIDRNALQRDFTTPSSLIPSIIVGFGYPAKKLAGKKSRKPMQQVAFSERYGEPIDPSRFAS
jgi:nitroreductase